MNTTHRRDRPSVIFFYNSPNQVNFVRVDGQSVFRGDQTELVVASLRREYLMFEDGRLVVDVPLPQWIIDLGLVAQTIDASGKTRMLFTEKGTVVTPPLHSMNLPQVEIHGVDPFDEIPPGQRPTSRVFNGDRLVGVWVGRFFLVMTDLDGGEDIPISNENPLVDIRRRSVDMVRDAERKARVILELATWMFSGSEISVDEFSRRYLRVVDRVPEYETTDLRVFLPADGDLRSIEDRFPLFIVDGRLVVTEKMRRGIEYYLRDFYPRNRRQRPLEITHVYSDPNDFPRGPDELVTIGNFSLSHYFDTSQPVHNTLGFEFITRREPYLYRVGGRLFLIQNVKDATFAKATFVSYRWETDGYNLGFDVRPPRDWDPFQYSIMIGAIAKDRSLGVVQRSAEDKIFVLRYFSNFYAAILAVN